MALVQGVTANSSGGKVDPASDLNRFTDSTEQTIAPGASSYSTNTPRNVLGILALSSGVLMAMKAKSASCRCSFRLASSVTSYIGVLIVTGIINIAYTVRRAKGETDGAQGLLFLLGMPWSIASWAVIDSGSRNILGWDLDDFLNVKDRVAQP